MPVLKVKDNRYYLLVTFNEREIPRKAGFKWHTTLKMWYTDSIETAWTMREFADNKAIRELVSVQKGIMASYATATDFMPPKPTTCADNYLPYQRAGVEWALNRKASLIGDEMGLGKTIQAIGTANAMGAKRMLVVCPAVAKYNWEREIQKWFIGRQNIQIIHGKSHIDADANILIVNYDLIYRTNFVDEIRHLRFDLGTFDELHNVKNWKAKRTRAALSEDGLTGKCGKLVGLTGTPILNRPIELYPVLSAWVPEIIAPYNDFYDYGRYFCDGHESHYGWRCIGATHTEELNTRLRTNFMIRRLKKDVRKDLPAKTLQMIPVEIKRQGEYLEIEKQVKALSEAKGGALGQHVELSTSPGNGDLGKIAKARSAMGLLKVKECLQFIKEELESEEKLVVFAYHKAVIDTLREGLKSFHPAIITGETPPKKRQEEVDRFQNESDCRVFIGNIVAAGVAITLTAASTVVFVETTWVPGEIDQAIDRCHRHGQKDAVLAKFLVVRGSLDEYMIESIVNKKSTIAEVLDYGN